MALSDIITALRILAQDTPTANLIRQEVPQGAVDGVNTKYRIEHYPVVSGSVYMTVGTSFRGQTGFTVDLVNGIIAYTVAPTAGSKPFECDYNYNWFTDTDHTQFLLSAAQSLGFAAAVDVPTGLNPAMLHYALHHFWERRASAYANKYSSSGGQAGHSVEVVTKAYKALSDTAMKDADKMRDDFYKKQGRRENPASGVVSYKIDPFTPRR